MLMTQGTIVVDRVQMRGFQIVSRDDGTLEISNDFGTLAITVDETGVPTLAPQSIKTAAIGDKQVTKEKIADKTITAQQLADTYATMAELNTRVQELIELLNTKAPMVNPTITGTITINDV